MIPLLPIPATIAELSEADAEAMWLRLRWESGQVRCSKCGGTDLYGPYRSAHDGNGGRWMCKKDGARTTLTTGTPFASAKVPIRTILLVLTTIQQNNGKKSLLRLSAELNITYKTFYVLAGKAQELLAKGFAQRSVFVGYMSKKGRRYVRAAHPRALIGVAGPSGGLLLNTRAQWTAQERGELARFSAERAPLDTVAWALGRTPQSIAEYAKDKRNQVTAPASWGCIVRRTRLTEPLAPHYSVYPYMPRLSKNAAATGALLTLDVLALVSEAYPSFMRADICQTVLLAILEGKTTLNDLRGSPDTLRAFVKAYRTQQDKLPGMMGTMRDSRSSLDVARGEDDDRDGHEFLPASVINRLEW